MDGAKRRKRCSQSGYARQGQDGLDHDSLDNASVCSIADGASAKILFGPVQAIRRLAVFVLTGDCDEWQCLFQGSSPGVARQEMNLNERNGI